MQAIPLQEEIPFNEAYTIIGGLSKPSKMPCYSWGISADHCYTGSVLAKTLGKSSPCGVCYAKKGFYRFPSVTDAHNRRLSGLSHPQWANCMVTVLKCKVPASNPYFRWFDSGDIQSYQHLCDIIWIARQLPHVKFWLPTQERQYVKRAKRQGLLPCDNLVIRISAPLIDVPPTGDDHASMVVSKDPLCPAKKQGNKCLQCRMCWDPNVGLVSYKEH